ncbi:21 kDa protein-like [Canna indica]|uniref:21 kDa protein-like n=1 Tax=Canna indica TaxID=4628 RepID=A0AAQ3KPS8_9LILI|nr:21 kDa protein-like [Canna indica]
MTTRSLTMLFFFFFFFLLLAIASCQSSSSAPAQDATCNATEFIRSQCRVTRYADLCVSSLSGTAVAARQSPVRLTCAAASITLARLLALRKHVSALRRAAGKKAAALQDCVVELGDAVNQVNRTVKELSGLDQSLQRTPEMAWRVSNAQTWMSAALTDEGTCSDGFEDVGGGGSVGADVRRRVEKSYHEGIMDNEIREKKQSCYADIER